MTSLHCLLAISRAQIESVASVTASVENDDVAQDMPEDILAMIRSQTSWTATHGSASVMFMEVKGGVDVFLDAPWTANDAYAGALVARELGSILDLHHDPRGVFVFPEEIDIPRSYEAAVAVGPGIGRFVSRELLASASDSALDALRAAAEAEPPRADRNPLRDLLASEGSSLDDVLALAKSMRIR